MVLQLVLLALLVQGSRVVIGAPTGPLVPLVPETQWLDVVMPTHETHERDSASLLLLPSTFYFLSSSTFYLVTGMLTLFETCSPQVTCVQECRCQRGYPNSLRSVL